SEASFDLVAQRHGGYNAADDAGADDPFAVDTVSRARAQDGSEDIVYRRPTPPPSQTTDAAMPVPVGAELEEALEEADFFASRGLYEDARTILEEHLTRLPNHPLIVERLAELDSQERGQVGGSGTREMPRHGPSVHPVDRSFDIAQSLGETEGASGDRASGVGGVVGRGGTEKQIDVEE